MSDMTRKIALHCMKSASELERELCEECPIYGQTGCDHCYEDALQYVIAMLEQESRWIPVSERLPKSDEEYHTFLVTDNKGRVTLSEFYLSISDRKPYWSGMVDVIAWMPLPQPYREVEG